MDSRLTTIFSELGRILAICPDEDCGHIFYLSEARPYLKGKQPKSIVDKLRAIERLLDKQEETLQLVEDVLRERAAKAGLRTAKTLLRKIDPVFSGAGYDPQDVKVIFNPITYIVFHGLAKDRLHKVRLLATPPTDQSTERIHKSIDQTISRGSYEFKVLRVDPQGQVTSQ